MYVLQGETSHQEGEERHQGQSPGALDLVYLVYLVHLVPPGALVQLVHHNVFESDRGNHLHHQAVFQNMKEC